MCLCISSSRHQSAQYNWNYNDTRVHTGPNWCVSSHFMFLNKYICIRLGMWLRMWESTGRCTDVWVWTVCFCSPISKPWRKTDYTFLIHLLSQSRKLPVTKFSWSMLGPSRNKLHTYSFCKLNQNCKLETINREKTNQWNSKLTPLHGPSKSCFKYLFSIDILFLGVNDNLYQLGNL